MYTVFYMNSFFFSLFQVRSEIAEEDEEDEELNVKKVKSKQKDKYVLIVIAKI